MSVPVTSDIPGPQARSVWAKTGSRGREWLALPQHMADSAAMAERLFDHWLAPGVKRRWGEAFPGGVDDARLACVFLAGVHDVGKASPVFAAQVETMARRNREAGLACPPMDELRDDRRLLPHATVSCFALRRWLEERGASETLSAQLASVIGAHHGKPATGNGLREARRRRRAVGKDQWAAVRDDLLCWMDARIGLSDRLMHWAEIKVPLPVQVGMSGLVIMADWLASNQSYFPLRPLTSELSPDLSRNLEDRWDDGWAEAGMPPSWSPDVPDLDVVDLYRARFDWNADTTPYALQKEVADLVSRESVGLLIIESAMGSGKTEAALIAAEILAAQWGAHGIFIALPTQATTDAMFSRMLKWLKLLPQPPEDVPAWALALAHGKATLNKEYADEVAAVEAFDAAQSGLDGIYDEDECAGCSNDLVAVVAHQWFRGRKRKLLANFGIGTIDQLLMAGLQQRHLMLRHLAFAGKVVVIDEVHASDEFMNVYLDAAIEWLGHYGVPVILLSATLTQQRKDAMVRAYAPETEVMKSAAGYPQLTWVDAGRASVKAVSVVDESPSRDVSWEWMEDSDQALVARLRADLRGGGCAVVVRNTVGDAQRCADLLAAADIAPVTLAHSRFLAADRAENDEDLRRRFGLKAGPLRPDRAIVVATQVVEQSLDIDFDVLVTDLAPMDLLFQRVGRLHRHHGRDRPLPLTEPKACVLFSSKEPLAMGSSGSHYIYGDYLLHRTALVLDSHGSTLSIPNDIAPLVERALSDEQLSASDEILDLLAVAEKEHSDRSAKQRQQAEAMCLGTWSPTRDTTATVSTWLPLSDDPSESRLGAMVRDSTPTLEVIVVPRLPDGTSAIVPPWMSDGRTIDTSSLPDDDMARRIATWSVKLPARLTRWPRQLDAVISAVEQGPSRSWAWHKHRLLKGELLLPMNQLAEGSHTLETTLTVGDRQVRLQYSRDRGLEEVTDDVQSD